MTLIYTPTSPEDLTLEDAYDMIMGSIEPELMSTNIDDLPELYKNETPEEQVLRLDRYKRAFVECNKVWSALMAHWDAALRMQALKLGETLQKKVTNA